VIISSNQTHSLRRAELLFTLNSRAVRRTPDPLMQVNAREMACGRILRVLRKQATPAATVVLPVTEYDGYYFIGQWFLRAVTPMSWTISDGHCLHFV
jgi:hypothetical protein